MSTVYKTSGAVRPGVVRLTPTGSGGGLHLSICVDLSGQRPITEVYNVTVVPTVNTH